MDLNLPNDVKPMWIEGIFTSEFERDTLPLLFAPDKVYNEYYDALRSKNVALGVAVDGIKERNNLARMERQEGMWVECVESLWYCVQLRKAVFEESDFQYTAALKHHIMALINFATFFLKESSSSRQGKDVLLVRSYEMFKKAEEAVAHVRSREDRLFLKAAIENNYSVYFAKRKKYSAAAQRVMMAVRSWAPLKLRDHQFYFAVQKGGGDLWSGRIDDAIIGLKLATTLVSRKKYEKASSPQRQTYDMEVSDDSSSSDGESGNVAPGTGGEAQAPFKYTIHVLNGGGLDATTAACIAVNHNLAIALIAQRRYKEAVPWVTRSLDIAIAHTDRLASNHPIVVAIRSAQQFCNQMAAGTKMSAFKMKKDEHSSEQYRAMQSAVAKAREVSSANGQRKPQSSADPHPPVGGQRGHSASNPPRFRKPSHVEALQTYLKHISYRQLIEDYGFEDPKKSRSRSPNRNKSQKSSAASSPKKKSEGERQNGASSDSEASPPRKQRSASPESSSSGSPPSPRSSRASSSHATPAGSPTKSAAVAVTPRTATPQSTVAPSPAASPGKTPTPQETPQKPQVTPQTEVSPVAAAQQSPNEKKAPASEQPTLPEVGPTEATPPEPKATNKSEDAPEAPAPAAAPVVSQSASVDSNAQPVASTVTPTAEVPVVEQQAPATPAKAPAADESHGLPSSVAPVVQPAALNDTTGYGDDGFESASEASPVKAEVVTAQRPEPLNQTNYTNDEFENTTGSDFTPLQGGPKHVTATGGGNDTTAMSDFSPVEPSPAPPVAGSNDPGIRQPNMNDTTYGDDTFDDD